MASKRKQRRDEQRERQLRAEKHQETIARQCGGKIAYEHPASATKAMLASERKFNRKMNIYHCPHCSTKASPKWHVGGVVNEEWAKTHP